MKTFRDDTGREWCLTVHVAAIKRVRNLLGVDLYGLVDDDFAGLGKLIADPVGLVDVLYVLCKPEADSRGVTDEAFGALMAGEVIDRATTAFLDEYADFFPDPRVRAGLRKMIQTGRVMQAKVLDHLMTLIDQIDPDSEAAKLIASFGSSREWSGSTPDPSPSANST